MPDAGASTENVEAHNAYLQGHFYFQRRNVEDYRKAIGFFDQAIRLDPDYALAYAERAEAWTFIGDLSPEEKKEAWADGEKGCREGRRGWSESRRGARGFGLGSFLCRVEVCRRACRTKARERTRARKSDRERSLGTGTGLCGSNRRSRETRLARRLNSTRSSYLAQGNLARILMVKENSMRQMRRRAKAAELQPAGAGNHRWQAVVAAFVATERQLCVKPNLSPTRLSPFRTCACALCARGSAGR